MAFIFAFNMKSTTRHDATFHCSSEMNNDQQRIRNVEATRYAVQSWIPLTLSLLMVLLIAFPSSANAAALGMERRESPSQRNVVVYNKSGRRIDVFWINRHTDPVSYQSNSEGGQGYPYGASQGINSYIGHEFEIREMPSKTTGQCKIPNDCKKGYFQVNDQEGQSK